MPNIRLIPVEFVVERAKAFKTAVEAMPLRTLLADWFASNHCEAEGFAALQDIDEHFPQAKLVGMNGAEEAEPVVLPGCVLARFRTNALAAKTLVSIIHEIHRRMNIPAEKSRKAKRPEDVRQDSWTWPHVMRVMIKRDIIADNTNKATFGAMIEQVLGSKVKPNSIRRANYGNYAIVKTYDYELSEQDKDVVKEITSLFLPLFKPQN
jgi:hypothetical protein